MDSVEAMRARLDSSADYYLPSDGLDAEILALDKWWIERYVEGPEVLELGCSEGIGTRLLLQKTGRVHVIEGSEKYCRLLQTTLSHPGLHVENTLFETFEPERRYHDIVLARALDYLESPLSLLSKIRKWLLPSGRLHLVVQNAKSLHRRMGVALGKLPSLEFLSPHSLRMGHRRIYTKDTLYAHLHSGGFQVDAFKGYFLKPFDYETLSHLASHDVGEWIQALVSVGNELPDELCNQFYVLCRPHDKNKDKACAS